jgi:hypothetical protein
LKEKSLKIRVPDIKVIKKISNIKIIFLSYHYFPKNKNKCNELLLIDIRKIITDKRQITAIKIQI